jgi:hypothetical protein
LRQEIYTFLNQRKIPLLLIPFAPNFQDIFSTLIRDRATFLEGKRSNKIETFQNKDKNKAKPESHEAK